MWVSKQHRILPVPRVYQARWRFQSSLGRPSFSVFSPPKRPAPFSLGLSGWEPVSCASERLSSADPAAAAAAPAASWPLHHAAVFLLPFFSSEKFPLLINRVCCGEPFCLSSPATTAWHDEAVVTSLPAGQVSTPRPGRPDAGGEVILTMRSVTDKHWLAKRCKRNLDPYCFVTSLDFLYLKNDVNVPSKSNKQKKLSFLLASWRSMTKIAGRIRIQSKMSWTRNMGKKRSLTNCKYAAQSCIIH